MLGSSRGRGLLEELRIGAGRLDGVLLNLARIAKIIEVMSSWYRPPGSMSAGSTPADAAHPAIFALHGLALGQRSRKVISRADIVAKVFTSFGIAGLATTWRTRATVRRS